MNFQTVPFSATVSSKATSENIQVTASLPAYYRLAYVGVADLNFPYTIIQAQPANNTYFNFSNSARTITINVTIFNN
ncbi:MAG: hypothetical protein IKT62_06285 [Firmicutes bacterium]|nr:hypothetical protein [Bacillota bacterium]